MIRTARLGPRPRRPYAHATPAISGGPAGAYRSHFWLTYASNFLVAAAVAVMYRFGDFITVLGGDEFHLGWIVGIGTLGSLGIRLAMGMGIDRHGPRWLWLGTTVLFAVTCFAHLAITSYSSPAVYVLRITYCCAMSGMYLASITFISGRTPLLRMAEMVGMLGTSGFLACIVGTQLGDFLRGSGELERAQLDRMFVVAGLLGLAAVLPTWLALRGYKHPMPAPCPSALGLVRRCHPGMLLAVVIVMGMALNLPSTFLPTYAADLGIERIALFFTVYSLAAVVTRVVTRRWPARLGLRAMVSLGVVALAGSQLLFLPVRGEWDLWLPGVGYGMAHAVLFPASLAVGNSRFPEQHRGLGTVLILAAWDIGSLVGMPAAGAVLHYSQTVGLPPYPTLFLLMAALAAMVGACCLLGNWRMGMVQKSPLAGDTW
jgi:MFS family permease